MKAAPLEWPGCSVCLCCHTAGRSYANFYQSSLSHELPYGSPYFLLSLETVSAHSSLILWLSLIYVTTVLGSTTLHFQLWKLSTPQDKFWSYIQNSIELPYLLLHTLSPIPIPTPVTILFFSAKLFLL